MMFEKSDLANLNKIGVKSLLDLALLIPKSFDDLSIKDEPNEGENVVEIEVISQISRPKMLVVTAFCKTWEQEIKITIFNARQWHYATFKRDKTMLIHGKCTLYNGFWTFTNPKIITKPGGISAHYKLHIRDASVIKLLEKYLTKDNLLETGLNEAESEFFLNLHAGTKASIDALNSLNSGDDEILKFTEIYNYLKKLSKKKFSFKVRKFEPFDISSWLNSLPFRPTNDQINATNDIRADFCSETAKRRVVMGDVGSGKTLVILAAALMMYPENAILMAPTTILAEQIYAEAKRLLPEFVNVKLVKSGEKADFSGVNFIIGTHTLLFQELPKSNLIMIDEQQRFGSNQRQQIAKMAGEGEIRPHFIQFSATPIPRTLSLIQSEIVNFSFLKEMPFPKDISTILLKNSGFGELLNHLKSEISKGNQAIIVYPLVNENEVSPYQSLNEGAPFWQERFKNVYVTFGKDKSKDEILAKFREDGDILVTTTLIEVGISLPRLSVIVVVGAERMGLATLHQLRGRVGRLGGKSWCYLYTKLKEFPPRLKEFAQTTDGFKVADIDLKTRQGGDLLDGTIQHGDMFKFYNYEDEITQKAKLRLENLAKIS